MQPKSPKRTFPALQPTRRFAESDRGIAAVEFALIVPIMLLVYLGAVDLTQGLMADRKLTHLAGTLGDLLSQDRLDEITSEDMAGYFDAGTALMQPYDGSATEMRLSILTVDASGDAEVSESVAVNGATALPDGTEVTLPEAIASLASDSGSCVVLSEAWYKYNPMFHFAFDAQVPLHQRSFNIARRTSEGCEAPALTTPPPDPEPPSCAGNSGGVGQGNNCNENENSQNEKKPTGWRWKWPWEW